MAERETLSKPKKRAAPPDISVVVHWPTDPDEVWLLLQRLLAALEREKGGTDVVSQPSAAKRPSDQHGRRSRPARPEIAALVDLDDETWIRHSVDELKGWALRGRELDQDMRNAATASARARALAALERHESEYRAIRTRRDDVEQRRAQSRIDREIAIEGWDRWLRRVTAERDARRKAERQAPHRRVPKRRQARTIDAEPPSRLGPASKKTR